MRIVGHRMRLTQAHVDRMRIPKRFWDVTFEQISEEARPKIDNYLRQLDYNLDNGIGLLLWGNNGVGKTSSAVFVGLEVRRRGASVFFTTTESLREAVLEREMFDGELVMERARSVDFLILDDLGKEHPGETGFTERLFENLFRKRSAMCRTTFVTTNLPMNSEEKVSRSLGKVYTTSMIEVLKETLYPVRYIGENLRDSTGKEIKERMTATG